MADFDFDEQDYKRVRDALVAEGLLAKGQGKGGTVYRTGAATPLSPLAASALAEQKAKREPAQPDDELESESVVDASIGADPYGTYQYDTKATSRPDVGVQEQFNGRKPPKQYRYDSSLAPELCWDENAERDFAEWLLNLVTEAATQGESVVFAQEQVWKGNGERFTSLSQCAARLKSLTQPFLNWAGKAERQQISVPTVPLFDHQQHKRLNLLILLGFSPESQA